MVRTVKLIEERRPAIEKIANFMCTRDSESVSGSELVQILQDTPLGPCSSTREPFNFEKAWLQDAHMLPNSWNGNGNGRVPQVAVHPSKAQQEGPSFVKFNSAQGKTGCYWTDRSHLSPSDFEDFEISISDARTAMEVVIGNVDLLEVLTEDVATTQINQVCLIGRTISVSLVVLMLRSKMSPFLFMQTKCLIGYATSTKCRNRSDCI